MATRDQILNLLPSSLRRPLRDLLDIGKTSAATATNPSDATAAALSDMTGGTADQTVADVSTAVTGVNGTGDNAASKADVDTRLSDINANFCDITDDVNKQITDVADIRTKLTALIADVESLRVAVSKLTE